MRKELYGLEKKGSYKYWSIEVVDHAPIQAMIRIVHGSDGGKLQEKLEYVTEGKQGRNVFEQAVLQAEARVKKQLDKNYRPTKEELEDIPLLAMLAQDASHVLEKKISQEDLDEGVFTSDKFDGLRTVAKCKEVGSVQLFSRTNQLMDIPHISAELALFMQPGDILDGELYVHGYVLEEINSAANRPDTQGKIDECQRKVDKLNKQLEKLKDDDHLKLEKWGKDEAKAVYELKQAYVIQELRPKLEFHVFDLVEEGVPFAERLTRLQEYARKRFKYTSTKLVEYNVAFTYADLYALHADAIERGYEGLMIRLRHFVYESGKRSNGLWKFKSFVDAEFLIRDIIEDKQDGSIYWCYNNQPNVFGELEEFGVTMGSIEERLIRLNEKELYIGQYITVQYQSRFKKSKLPQFPTGKALRQGYYFNGEFIPT